MNVLSLFDGISCGRVALEKAGHNIEKFYASEIDKYAIKTALSNYPDTEEIGDISLVNGHDYEGIDLIMGGSPCFATGTLITTQRGLIPIENILIGDKVLTHTHKFRKVTDIMSRISNEIVNLTVQGCGTIKLTPNHRIYVRDRIKTKKNGKFNIEYSEPYWKSIKELNGKEIVLLPENKENINEKFLSEVECWLLGRYVADGYLRNYKRKDRKNTYIRYISFCIGNTKIPEFQEKIQGYTCNAYTDHNCTKFHVSNKRLYSLAEEFGKLAHEKKIPNWIMSLPNDLLEIFLDGYMSGDGSYNYEQNKYKTYSTSKILIYQLSQIITKLYHSSFSIIYLKKPSTYVIEGRTVNQRDSWEIDFYKDRREKTKTHLINKELWVPIKKIEFQNNPTFVYNLEVEIDNSYTANNMAVHNCQGFSNAGKGRNFEDPRSKLFWEFVRILEEAKPKYFLLENVCMKKEWENIITEALGVQPIMINSALVSAAVRKRLYWTNIPDIKQPDDLGITFGDIREHNVPNGTIYYSAAAMDWIHRHETRTGKKLRLIQDNEKMQMLEASMFKKYSSQRFFGIEDTYGIRYITVKECERCMNLPDGYTSVVSNTQAYKQLGNGWNVNTIKHIFSTLK